MNTILEFLNPRVVRNFWKRVHKLGNESGCWIWEGAENVNGYGQMSIYAPRYRQFRCHRISLAIHGVEFSDEDVVCHKCDTPLCVNPNHLFVGNQLDNLRDCRQKNRHMKGNMNPISKLTPEAVREIREVAKEGYGSQRRMAKKYRVSEGVISEAVSGKTWAHVL